MISLLQNVLQQLQTIFLECVFERLNLVLPLQGLHKHVLLKDASSFDAVRKNHDSDAVLDALVPHAHIGAFVHPLHHTVTMALIFIVVTLIAVAGLPLEDTMTMLLIILIHALVHIALSVSILISLLFLPFAMAMLQTIHKLACVTATILPLVLAESLRLALLVLTHVAVSVGEEVRTVAVAQALEPLALVLVTIFKDVHAIPFSFSSLPLADVGFTVCALPDAVAMFDAHEPLTVIDLAVLPLVDSFTIRLAILVRTMIRIARGKELVATAATLIREPLAFVDSSVGIDENAVPLTLLILIEQAFIDAIFVLLDTEVTSLTYLLIVELVAYHLILLKGVAIVLELPVSLARGPETFLDHLLVDVLRNL